VQCSGTPGNISGTQHIDQELPATQCKSMTTATSASMFFVQRRTQKEIIAASPSRETSVAI
jgi:hypothetical protein